MPAAKEFFAGYDFQIVAASSKAERNTIEQELKSNTFIREAFENYWDSFEEEKRVLEALYEWQNVEVEGERSGAQPDAYRYFAERVYQLLKTSGSVGIVLPSAFHANEGATGIRQLYLRHMALRLCYSFENRSKLFEIDSRLKFAAVIASKQQSVTAEFACAFYLHDDEWLFRENQPEKLIYTLKFVNLTGGKYFGFIELRSRKDVEIVEQCSITAAEDIESKLSRIGISCGEELNKTRQSPHFRRIPEHLRANWGTLSDGALGGLLVYEGRNIWQFDDRFETVCEHYFPYEAIFDRPDLAYLARYYRFGYRLIASSTNERTLVATVLVPGCVCTQSISIERRLKARKSHEILEITAFWNSFTTDWMVRQRVGAAVNKFLLEAIPVPQLKSAALFLAHSALRLVSNHYQYGPLWKEQLGDAWREGSKELCTWPVLATEEKRWEIRSAIDAIVADAYGLSHDQYEHVLHSFDRASGSNPYTTICLEKFEELKNIGIESFTKKYDPYWDIPLVETLPKPVIELPDLAGVKESKGQTAMNLEEV